MKCLSNNKPAASVISEMFARQIFSMGRKRRMNFDFEIFVSAMSRTIFTPNSTGFSIDAFMKTQLATSVLTAGNKTKKKGLINTEAYKEKHPEP